MSDGSLLTDQVEDVNQVGPDPFENSGKPAIVISPVGAPAIVLSSAGNRQTQKIILRCDDVVYIDRDLFVDGERESDMLLTKCFIYRDDGSKVDLVIARNLIQVIGTQDVAMLQRLDLVD
jgi:hypothetical protein